ncbi:iron-containing redox enzyme family protein [Arenibaculum sp.]|jgi:hypothetical protein|uniref:iron-containing redox enzyme family protein n=1 Tax=Arenibaculum sp. TaxID=2865862 RepID=UPI002E11AAEF|nr:iron-containing redox enzyme family protein [Arenibaculum sp.]
MMLNVADIREDGPALQQREWPPVDPFDGFAAGFREFLDLADEERHSLLARLHAADPERHGAFLHEALGAVYGYVYGYADSPLHLATDDALEARLLQAKLILERELEARFLQPEPVPDGLGPEEGCAYLREFVARNRGVLHPFFDTIRDRTSPAALREFLRIEVIRNEVVDDEVALLVVGLQGAMKKVVSSNLWDECGNGRLAGFHTYWLRRLLERTGDWDGIRAYRRKDLPWFARITSNSFNRVLTRPGLKYQAYGHFLVTEAWVLPHFERVVDGLRRVGLDHQDVGIYFNAHIRIDPHHTEELLAGLLHQRPSLSVREVAEVIRGAHAAAAAGTAMYRRLAEHLAAPER